jgi:uncharacterized protein with HEPN domain
MRPERLYLHDIAEAIQDIEQIVAGRGLDALAGDITVRRAVLHALMVIGEAASKLPVGFKDRHPEVPWRQIVAFRNVVVHGYFALDWDIIRDALTYDLPELKGQIAAVTSAEFPQDTTGDT